MKQTRKMKEAFLRAEGWRPSPRFVGKGWFRDPVPSKDNLIVHRDYEDGYPKAVARKAKRECRRLRFFGWISDPTLPKYWHYKEAFIAKSRTEAIRLLEKYQAPKARGPKA